MSKVVLKNYKIRELHFKNKVAGKATIELEQRQSFKVHYLKDKNECIGQCRIEIKDKNQEQGKEQTFVMFMEVEGVFAYETEMDKAEMHSDIYKELFPYVRVLINNFTVSAGMPPMVARALDMESIHRANTPVSTIVQ